MTYPLTRTKGYKYIMSLESLLERIDVCTKCMTIDKRIILSYKKSKNMVPTCRQRNKKKKESITDFNRRNRCVFLYTLCCFMQNPTRLPSHVVFVVFVGVFSVCVASERAKTTHTKCIRVIYTYVEVESSLYIHRLNILFFLHVLFQFLCATYTNTVIVNTIN